MQAQLLDIIHDPWDFLTFLHSHAASTFVGNDEDAPCQCDFLVYVGDAPPKSLFFSLNTESFAFSLLFPLSKSGWQMAMQYLHNHAMLV